MGSPRRLLNASSVLVVPTVAFRVGNARYSSGGNTWAGGTGGRDTAGLGGKGGPYRLDAGHAVHQLSLAEKDSVPEHVKKAARQQFFFSHKTLYAILVLHQYLSPIPVK